MEEEKRWRMKIETGRGRGGGKVEEDGENRWFRKKRKTVGTRRIEEQLEEEEEKRRRRRTVGGRVGQK